LPHAPYARWTFVSGSERRGKFRWNFVLNRTWESLSSRETPSTIAPDEETSGRTSRNAHASTVHPGVSSFG
jgi:hypothetical protein